MRGVRVTRGGWVTLMTVAVGVGTCCTQPSAASTAGARPRPCAERAPRTLPAPTWAPAQTELAPPGAASIRLCRYGGLNDRPRLGLAYQALLTKPQLVAHLTREFDALPKWPDGATAQGCPFDDASQIVAVVAYPAGRTVTISVALRGCMMVTNGSVSRTAAGIGPAPRVGPQLEHELARITRYRRAG